MNIVAHCPVGTAFLHSEDASAEKHNANYIFQFVEKQLEMWVRKCGSNCDGQCIRQCGGRKYYAIEEA